MSILAAYYETTVERLVKRSVLFSKEQTVCIKKRTNLPHLASKFRTFWVVSAILVQLSKSELLNQISEKRTYLEI